MVNSTTAKAMREGGLNGSKSHTLSPPFSQITPNQKQGSGASKASATSQAADDANVSKEGPMMSIKERETRMAQEKEEAGYQTFLFSLF